MSKWVIAACGLALLLGIVHAETLEETPSAPSFSLSAGSVPQLLVQQEVMRRVADVYLGFSAATHFQLMASSEMQSYQASDAGMFSRFGGSPYFSDTGLVDDVPALLPDIDGDGVVDGLPLSDDDMIDSELDELSTNGDSYDTGSEFFDDDVASTNYDIFSSELYDSTGDEASFDMDDDDTPFDSDGMDSQDFTSSLEEDDDDEAGFLEVGRTFRPISARHRRAATHKNPTNLEMIPLMGQPQQPPQQGPSDVGFEELQHRGALEKLHALKFLQMQIALTASDVDKAYWMNKLMATYMPQQLLVWKVYKNYLSTLALSFMMQLHDSFTLEAFQDEFNDHYGQAVGDSSHLTEALAEHKTYSTWYYLSVLKFQLFFVNMYEQMAIQRASGQPTGSGSSFLETELKTQPSIGGHPQALLMQYAYISYFTYVLKFFSVYLEMGLSSHGMIMGNSKVHSFSMQKDDDPTNDEQAEKLMEQAKEIDSKYLPAAFNSWATVNQWRFMFDFYLLFLDAQMPAMAAASMAAHTQDAIQNTNFVQTEEPTLRKD